MSKLGKRTISNGGVKMNNVKRYRTKPVEIEAVLYEPENLQVDEFLRWFDCQWRQDSDGIVILTPEGNMKCLPGNYIIKGLEGEFYPCMPSVFYAKYAELKPCGHLDDECKLDLSYGTTCERN